MNLNKRVVTAVLLSLVGGSLALGGAVFAASSGQANGDCNMAYYTETTGHNVNTPGGVATVTMTKSCQGPVEGRFTSEIYDSPYSSVANNVAISMKATCLGTGGFTSPCTVGEQVTALPGTAMLQMCGADLCTRAGQYLATHGMNMVWPSLKRGIWKFDVLRASGDHSFLSRTFTVEAFTQ